VVPAGQRPAGPGWLADPGWWQLIVAMPVGNLSAAGSQRVPVGAPVPEDRRDRVVQFTPSRPLRLALVAETLAHDGDCYPHGAPDVIGTLVEQFVPAVPATRP
jgi:hypothetical protein